MVEKTVLIEVKKGVYFPAIEKRVENHYEYFSFERPRVGEVLDFGELGDKVGNPISCVPKKGNKWPIIELGDKNYDEVLKSLKKNTKPKKSLINRFF